MQYIQSKQIESLVYRQREPGFFSRGKCLKEATLLYIAEGSLHFISHGCDRLLSPGDMVLCPPDHWYMTYAQKECAPCLLELTFSSSGQDFAIISTPPSPITRCLLDRLLEECRTPDGYSAQMCQLLLDQFLLQLHRENVFAPASAIRGEYDIINRAQIAIGNHTRHRLNVSIVAQKIGVSPSYLTALFLKHLQMGPGEYIRRAKLQESKNMIREGTHTFTEIAAALEYSTVHHFSRQFKDNFGITPTQYAKSVQ